MRIIEKLPHASRIVLGLVFTVFGLNGFLQFLPQPPLPEAAVPFITGLASSVYLFPVLKAVEVIAGVLLLANTAVPFALVLLAPILINIVGFHAFLSPGLGMPLVLSALTLHLAWVERARFAPLFGRAPKAAPDSYAPAAVPSAAE